MANQPSALATKGHQRYERMSADEKLAIGKRSKDIAFVYLIGNPYVKVRRGTRYGTQSIGLVLKNVSQQPIDVLKFKQKSTEVMDADYAHPTQQTIKPNETFILTWAEAGAFVSRDEINGYILGGDEGKQLRYVPINDPNRPIPMTKFVLIGNEGHRMADFCVNIADENDVKQHRVKAIFQDDFAIFAGKPKSTKPKAESQPINAAALAVGEAFSQLIHQKAGENE